ncbi:MAG: RNA-directed DNA polymerase [Bacteroidales bacterium]|nr:RNA-directed DNA polymerase [Bacteroidales bacterium]
MKKVAEITDRRAEVKAAETRIHDLWSCLHTKRDLLRLVNVALEGLYGMDARTVTMRQLNLSAYSSLNAHRYRTFQIPKKRKGEFRTIDAPDPTLKYIQQGLNFVLQTVHTPHPAAMGFVPHRSTVTGAKVHLGQRFVYNIDLKDFFHTVTSGRLYKRLTLEPFCLDGEVAGLITDLCCYMGPDGRNVLPMGAPTSPAVTNIICERMDGKLSRLARVYGLKYSRYADDITFSGMADVFAEDGRFIMSMRNIIVNEEGFTINPEKTRLCHWGMRQEVTGITVNSRENVPRKYVKQLRTMIHNWEMDGHDKAQAVFEKYYMEQNYTHNPDVKHHIENVVAGKLLYLKMVKGETDPTYRALDRRFRALTETGGRDTQGTGKNRL